MKYKITGIRNKPNAPFSVTFMVQAKDWDKAISKARQELLWTYEKDAQGNVTQGLDPRPVGERLKAGHTFHANPGTITGVCVAS